MRQAKIEKLNKDKGKMNRQLYVLPCFLRPGKQTFIVQCKVYEEDLNLSNAEINAKINSRERSFEEDSNISDLSGSGDLTDPICEQFFFHQCTAPIRRERIPLFIKQLKRKTNDSGKFNRDLTVFKDWKTPTEKDLQGMLEHDK